MSVVLRRCLIYPLQVKSFNKIYFKKIANGGQYAATLNEQSLTSRILNYLNGDAQSEKKPHNVKDLMHSLKTNDKNNYLHKVDNSDLVNVFKLVDKEDYFRDEYELIKLVNVLDLECCLRLDQLDFKTIFKFLSNFTSLIPNKIVDTKFYQLAMEQICDKIRDLNKDDLVQYIFYLGLTKSVHLQKKIKACLKQLNDKHLDELTTEDLCIVCNSTFKTSTKITNKLFLDKVRNYLQDNLFLLKDPALFVTFVKTIRHNRYQNEDLLETIKCAIFFNKTLSFYTFASMCHILALYSDHLYYDEKLFDSFTKKCIGELRSYNFKAVDTYLTEQPRIKDVKRFVWALSNVNYKGLNRDEISNVIIPRVMERIRAGEFKSDPGSLVEFMLYLWMLKYRAYELVPYIFKKTAIRNVRETKSLSKHRLNLLLSCIYFEDRDLYKNIGVRAEGLSISNMKVELERREELNRVTDALKYVASKCGVNRFQIGYQIPYLNILGVTGYKDKIDKCVHIEILDDYTCVKNRGTYPSGSMDLKLRILDGLEQALIVVSKSDIDGMIESELQEYLLEEIELVC